MPVIYENNVAGCCAIKAVGEFDYDYEGKPPAYVGKRLEETIAQINKYCDHLRAQNKSLVFASLNSQQVSAQAVLEGAGFKPITEDWVYRRPESEYKVGVKAYMKVLCPEITLKDYK